MIKPPMLKLLKTSCIIALAPLLLATHAMGAVIIWNTPADVDITIPGQVTTTGSLVAALSGNGPLTVNGVAFAANPTPNFTLAASSGGALFGGNTGNTYHDMLIVGIYLTNSNAATTPEVISGLTSGQSYQVQIWTSYFGADFKTRFSSSAPDGATNSTAPNQSALLNLGYNGDLPQFITGTFTADGPVTNIMNGTVSQNLYVFGSNTYGVIGALQVRTLPVPEPNTIALLFVSAIACVIARSRFRRSALLES